MAQKPLTLLPIPFLMSKKNNRAFEEAVSATPHVQSCYKAGLQALGKHSEKVEVKDGAKCEGSLDIDVCTMHLFPDANRWDYALCYDSEVHFVEVHSANTSEVAVVLRKLQWLKDWLHNHAPKINKLKITRGPAFYWIQSGNFNIPKNAPQLRIAAQKGIKPISKLKLPVP